MYFQKRVHIQNGDFFSIRLYKSCMYKFRKDLVNGFIR